MTFYSETKSKQMLNNQSIVINGDNHYFDKTSSLFRFVKCMILRPWRKRGLTFVRVGINCQLFGFLSLLGTQNDYLYIGDGAPFPGPHLWKTRMGFRLSWELSRIIHSN